MDDYKIAIKKVTYEMITKEIKDIRIKAIFHKENNSKSGIAYHEITANGFSVVILYNLSAYQAEKVAELISTLTFLF